MRKHLEIAALLAITQACTCHSTDSTEIGVVTRTATLLGILGEPGIQEETFAPGQVHSFLAFTTDWHVYDTALQNLTMVQDPSAGDREGEDDVELKTTDGNDVRVDTTVVWQIDPKRAPYILKNVGETTEEVKEKLVRPACRSIVRDVLNSLHSEDFYQSDKKFEKAEEARATLQAVLGPEGINVSQVILGEHHFHPQYQEVIMAKKLAEQDAERLKSQAKAAAEQSKRDLEGAKGRVSQQLATASGELDKVKLQSDAMFFENQQKATAIKAEKAAHAQSVKKQNEALAGQGGKTMVKLRIAEALQDKQILFIPTGGKNGVGVQTLNLNQLLGTLAGTKAE